MYLILLINIPNLLNKLFINTDNTAATENLESARSSLFDIMKANEKVAEINKLIRIEKDPSKIIELQKRLDELNIEVSGKCVSAYDKLNNVDSSD